MFDGMNFKNILISILIRGETTKSKQCTGKQNHLFPFLVKKVQPIKGPQKFDYFRHKLCFERVLNLKV